MSFLRRGSPAPEGDEDDSAVAEDLDTSDNGAPVADQQPASPPQSERQQKSGQRATRMDLIRQARKASAGMEDPEPVRGLMVAGFLVAVGLLSYLSKDEQPVSEKLHGKTHVVNEVVTHPETAILLIVVALAAAGTIYWRRRYVTSIAFMISAAVGIGTPFPKGLSDLMWLTFLVPAGYVLWVLMFRMNRQQKAWLAAHGASSQGGGGGGSSGSSSKRQAQRSQQASTSGRSRKGKPETPTSSTTGRALPENSGRYTRPKSKPPAGQRRS